ncbi:MAG: DEAD/DEAH box helicase [Acidimicrobiia bacterium]
MSLSRFWAGLRFEPDHFQVQAAEALERGKSVFVAAPTGAGKTVVGEAAVHLAVERRRRAFYTTPLKALSNQKYLDFSRIYTPDRVGLLTGDNVIAPDAPIVVMTTEVLRNMIYASAADLASLDVVILDEVHYLQDPSRGGVWEEVMIHLDRSVQVVALSATVSNAKAFGEWMEERRGPTELIYESERPVPLDSLYLIADRYASERLVLHPLYGKDGVSANPVVARLLSSRRGKRRRFSTPRRSEIASFLSDRGMLPAIYFIFSRAGCEAAASRLIRDGLTFTSASERGEIRGVAERRTASLTDAEREALGYEDWLEGLVRGIAPHHAGMVSAFKETVEELFLGGLVRIVFATETLSLGINMPAKTVVLESTTKFTGEAREPLRPGDYTQLTGRAGRRGIDERGFGVILYSPYVNFDRVAGTAGAGSHPIASSFRPTYNMAVNLIANYDQSEAERLLNASFGQFTRAKQLGSLRRLLRKTQSRREDAQRRASCERGDVKEYAAQLRSGSDRASQDAFARRLQQGSVLDVPAGPRAGRNVVLQRWRGKDMRVLVVGGDGQLARVRLRDLPAGTEHLGRIKVPAPYRPRSAGYRTQLRESAARFRETERVALSAGSKYLENPVHDCPDRQEHLDALDLGRRLDGEIGRQERQIKEAEQGLVGKLRSITTILEAWDYVDGWTLTNRGELLRFIYSELDLLVAETIHRNVISDLEPAEMAAFFSAFVYEPRREGPADSWPTQAVAAAGQRLITLQSELAETEKALGLSATRVPEPGISELVYRWASGSELDVLLEADELAAGDFVRNCRQLIDLLRQVRDAAPDLASLMRATIDLLDRNVVAATGNL